MNEKAAAYRWAKQEQSDTCDTVECPVYDEYKDFKRDPTGVYVLIRPNFDQRHIELAVCQKDHKIIKIFHGKRAQDVYNAVFQYEKRSGVNWFKEKTHIAYLGKELKKAEIVVSAGAGTYLQE